MTEPHPSPIPKFSPFKFLAVLTAISAVLLGIHTFFMLSHNFLAEPLPEFLVARFHVDNEANIPTWYASTLLFGVALAAYFRYRQLNAEPATGLGWRKFWLIFAGFYLFLSLDEGAQIHELFDRLTEIKWIFVYAPLAAAFFLANLVYFLRFEKNISLRNWVIGGLLVFALGGMLAEWVDYAFKMKYAWRLIEVALEEGLELTGTALVLTGCLQALLQRHR